MKFSKKVNNKKCTPKLIFFTEKKMKNIWIIFDIENWLWKLENGLFSIAWFRADVDLPKKFFYEKVLFFTQLSYHLMCKLLKKSYMLSSMYGSISKHEAWHKRHMHLVSVETNLENVILTFFFPFCTKWVIWVQSTLY